MAIRTFTGLPRQGKSYHAHVTEVIESLRLGCRVVTNITGYTDPDVRARICVYFKIKAADLDRLLIIVTSEQLKDAASYPYVRPDGTRDEGTLIQPGDILVIDEAFLIWNEPRKTIDERISNYFRLHGKYTNDRGYSAQIILITQALSDLHPSMRVVVEYDFNVESSSFLGRMFAKRYTVTPYFVMEGTRKGKLPTRRCKRTSEGEQTYRSFFAPNGKSDTQTGDIVSNRYVYILIGSAAMLVLAVWFIMSSIGSGFGTMKDKGVGLAPAVASMHARSLPAPKDAVPVKFQADGSSASGAMPSVQGSADRFFAMMPTIECWAYGPRRDGGQCDATYLRGTEGEDAGFVMKVDDLGAYGFSVDAQPCRLTVTSQNGNSRTWTRSACPPTAQGTSPAPFVQPPVPPVYPPVQQPPPSPSLTQAAGEALRQSQAASPPS